MNTVKTINCPYDLSAETLKTGSIFGALSPSAIEYLVNRGKLVHLDSGDVLFEDGDKGDSFYIIITGTLCYYQDNATATSLIRRVTFGQALGYVTMISLSPRNGYANADGDTVILEVDYNVFGEFHDKFAFDFGILILNLSRDMARNIQILSHTLAEAGVSVDLSKPSNSE
ncbi:Cyclic nucleotide-binding domain protein [Marinomonas aquimarina]|uniref:Cyclic nucleotide-binding domain protein n=1 Tax=Marinomonas aquimarina TaxID=295068 RepID=A0A1A8TFK4_9GAMM|nr:cyclic nucleotide-binding domain-containing protein [Marinomonas aquimarina]SBS31316.1 Cyclic nucleotide-binding domain protein [Marinomonas aquimarina]